MTEKIVLTQEEIDEIDRALDVAEKIGKIDSKEERSSFFLGFVGEKLMEKFLDFEFCDMSFDKPRAFYYRNDCTQLCAGIKTIYLKKANSGMMLGKRIYDKTIWANSLDLEHIQFIAYVDCVNGVWSLTNVTTPTYIIQLCLDPSTGRTRYRIDDEIDIESQDSAYELAHSSYWHIMVDDNLNGTHSRHIYPQLNIEEQEERNMLHGDIMEGKVSMLDVMEALCNMCKGE